MLCEPPPPDPPDDPAFGDVAPAPPPTVEIVWKDELDPLVAELPPAPTVTE
jgi:hypothetical protein